MSAVKEDLSALVNFLEQVRPVFMRLDEQVRELRNAFDGLLQEKTNRRLNMLTILSALYLPPTFFAGFFGMNFKNIPITEMAGGYWIVVGMMATLVAGQLILFWHRGWFS